MPELASFDDLARALRRERAMAGSPSFAELVRRIGRLRTERGEPHTAPGRVTVYDAFRDGRRRVDVALVLDLVAVLDPNADLDEWRRGIAGLTGGPGRAVVAAALPDGVPLIGRSTQVAALAGIPAGTAALITGLPGTGKTETALAAARRMGSDPLIVSLEGYHHTAAPLRAEEAAPELLRRIGVPGAEIARLPPSELPRRWREAAAERDLVLILDDASPVGGADALIPGGRCRTLVTSRHATAVTADLVVTLDPLTEDDALALLGSVVGRQRLDSDADAARAIAALAGGIPVEVLVLGGAVARRDGWSLADHVHALSAASRASSVRPALEAGLRHLSAPQRRLLRLLALHPETPLTRRRAELLSGTDAEADLAALVDAHLLTRSGPFLTWHDLVRDVAHAQLLEHEPHSAQRAAVARLLSAELGLLVAAVEALHPGVAGEVAAPPALRLDTREARDHLATDLDTLLALPATAQRWGFAAELSDLSALLFPVLTFEVRLGDAVALHTLAARSGDPAREAQARRHLARALEEQGRYRQAVIELEAALELGQGERDRLLTALGNVHLSMDDLPGAVSSYEAALGAATDPLHRGFAAANLSEALRRSGDLGGARVRAEEALDVFTDLGHAAHQSQVAANLALIAQADGRADEALALLATAADRARQVSNRGHYLRVRAATASVLIDLGRLDEAQDAIDEVLAAVDQNTLADLYHETLADRDRLREAMARRPLA